jgi:hypothetical protein
MRIWRISIENISSQKDGGGGGAVWTELTEASVQ